MNELRFELRYSAMQQIKDYLNYQRIENTLELLYQKQTLPKKKYITEIRMQLANTQNSNKIAFASCHHCVKII